MFLRLFFTLMLGTVIYAGNLNMSATNMPETSSAQHQPQKTTLTLKERTMGIGTAIALHVTYFAARQYCPSLSQNQALDVALYTMIQITAATQYITTIKRNKVQPAQTITPKPTTTTEPEQPKLDKICKKPDSCVN